MQTPIYFSNSAYLNTASLTTPTGLVKLINQALGHNSLISSIISNITGTVLNALNNPPAPFVSCPNIPYFPGILSSRILASSCPTRN